MADVNDIDGIWGYVRDGGPLHGALEGLVYGLEWLVAIIDLLAIAILLIGAARFLWDFARAELSGRDAERRVRGMNSARLELGRYILAGLELLIVSDILHTALSLAMVDLLFLTLLVVVRSLISYFLDRELKDVRRQLSE